MAQDKEPRLGYKNPLGHLTLQEINEMNDNDTLDDYMKQKLSNRKCLARNTVNINKSGCFYCEEHLSIVKSLINK